METWHQECSFLFALGLAYKGKVKSACEPSGPSGRRLTPGFCSVKRLGILLLPSGWDASPSQGYPPAL